MAPSAIRLETLFTFLGFIYFWRSVPWGRAPLLRMGVASERKKQREKEQKTHDEPGT
jgi:hypothetical protein